MTFIFKKIITFAILPPGILILLLLLSAAFLKKKLRLSAVLIAILLYLCSIAPVNQAITMPLEYAYKLPSMEDVKKCDAYVVLGGGINENAPSIDGEGTLGSEALVRVFEAYRLYLIEKKPIIFSGGAVFGKKAEADVAKKVLMSLGLKENHIIPESMSKDTFENAKLVKEICDKYKFRRILLVTSAFHMKRSVMLFEKHFKEITPYPVGHTTSKADQYMLLDFFPSAGGLYSISMVLKEYMGILFYKITL